MARIRTIKPSLWGDEKFSRVSLNARLLYIGLVSMADDDGRFLGSSAAIRGYVFPNDDIPDRRLRGWLDELHTIGLVVLYECGGFRYGVHLNYRKHQKISHPQPSPLPPPEEVLFG